MSKKVEAYKCEECGRIFTDEEAAKHENHKVASTRGDPIVKLY